MNPLHAVLASVVIAVTAKSVAWLIQRRTRNAGLVDAVWAWTLSLLAIFYGIAGSAPADTRLLLATMGGLWGLRLGLHLWGRNSGRPEDWRYARFREKWGARANFNMFWFFQFQNVFTLLLSASAFLPAAFRGTDPPQWAFALAVAIWCIAVGGEAIADRQLESFRANPMNQGRVCRDGLWRYSRHPNYFFECLHWCAYLPLALGAPYGGLALGAPLVMALLLMKLSGVPLLEEEMVKRKPAYAEYIRSTNALIPGPPRNRETGQK